MKTSRHFRVLSLLVLLGVAVGLTFMASAGTSIAKPGDMNITAYGELGLVPNEGSDAKTNAPPLNLKVAKAVDEKGMEISMLKGMTIRLAAQKNLITMFEKYKVGDPLMIKGVINPKDKILAVKSYMPIPPEGSGSK
ncbi:MAG: hypothetical protein U0Y68_26595 [Blastocatellia bacterium]